MKIFLSIAIILQILALSVDAQDTTICSKIGQVLDANMAYEKSICFVKSTVRLLQGKAQKFCSSKNMRLYNPSSSVSAMTSLSEFAMAEVENLKPARIARNGTKCQIVNSAGKVRVDPCTNSYFSYICQFKYPGSALLPKPGQCGIEKKNRIVGGENALIQQFPWLGTLKIKWIKSGQDDLACGGALINDRYFLTAAHCIIQNEFDVVGVRLGEYDKSTTNDCDANGNCVNDGAVDFGIEKTINHKLYDTVTKHNDITLLRLDRKVTFSDDIMPICLPIDKASKTRDLVGEVLTAAGWGDQEEDAENYPDILKTVTLKGVSNSNCQKTYNDLQEKQLCAGGVEGEDTCQGDSGGPLSAKNSQSNPQYWQIFGVVSFGRGCGRDGIPGVYTRVSEYISWIESNIKP